MTDLPLADTFPAADREAWLDLVEKTLKGADFEKRLVTTTYDGLRLQPIYGQSREAALPRKSGAGWAILQRADMPSIEDANAQALRDLEAGASGLTVLVAGHGGPSGFGVNAATVADFDRLLDGVYLEMIPLRLDAGPKTAEAAAALLGLYEKRGLDATKADISLGHDPIGQLALHGAPVNESPLSAVPAGDAITVFQADGRTFHNAGASEAQELAGALASALTYVRWLEASGFALDGAVRQVSMVLSVDADMFLSAAKLRAARLLWARVQEAMDLAPQPLKLHAEASWRMLSKRDPHVNLLRATAATFAAATAGADSLTMLAFTSAIGLPDRFARRMARNVQLVLGEESRLGYVSDPAAGSGYMDTMAHELAAEAWRRFQKIEEAGGIVAALSNGSLQAEIAETRHARAKNIAKRKDALTGVSEFPHLAESPAEVLAPLETPTAHPENTLAACRTAEPFEALRDAADAAGKRPSVFLANLGPVAAFTARATWAANVFEAAGIEALQTDGFDTAQAAAAAFSESGADIAILCSSDEVYETLGANTAKALSAAGATHIYLAGRDSDTLAAAGVGTFVYAGCDILAVLNGAHELLGVA
ncbi:MAG: methylmalonyl-CoA mutase family protein [Pseudomonadota bacterium]